MATAPAGLTPPPQGGGGPMRPRELQDSMNRHLFHPLAARLARLLLPTGLSPNAVSIFGLLLLWGATYCYLAVHWPEGALIGFALHLFWHVTDGADGDLARLRGCASPTGELVDGVCDYAGHTIMYIAFAFVLDDWIGGWAWMLAILAGASHIAQTNHAETQKRAYLWWAYGVPWLKNARERGDEVFTEQGWVSANFSWMARDYLKLAGLMAPGNAAIDAAVAAAAGDPARTRRIRRLVRRGWRRALLLEKALGANPKTLLIGGSMLLGSPVWFFLVEIVPLNLLLVWSVIHHNRRTRRLAAALDG
jgi:hypothetical protein